MPDTATLKRSIRDRISELEGERDALTRALDALEGGGSTTRRGRPAGRRKAAAKRTAGKSRSAKTTGTRGRRKRGRPRGSGPRSKQAVELVRAKPGITVSELADAMKIAPNYLYRVMPNLQKEGLVRKRGKGYHPAAKK